MVVKLKMLDEEFDVELVRRSYPNGAPALEGLEPDGCPFARFTVNIPVEAHRLGKDEAFFKTWNENEGLFEQLQALGVVGPTLFTVKTGYVEAPAARLLKV